jgi:hypothetical protein
MMQLRNPCALGWFIVAFGGVIVGAGMLSNALSNPVLLPPVLPFVASAISVVALLIRCK